MTTPAPTLIPAYYLTPDTRDWPYALLLDGCAPTPEDPRPVAHGVRFITSGDRRCEECPTTAIFEVECTMSGGGNPAYNAVFCAPCAIGGDHRGFVPMCYIDLIPYDE
jgi:hypothetical protein